MQTVKTKTTQPSQWRTVEEIAKLLGVPPYLDFDSDGHAYSVAYREMMESAIAYGTSEDEATEAAETAGMAAEHAEEEEAEQKHWSAFESAVESAFENVGLVVEFDPMAGVKISPATTWQSAACKLMSVINGDGICGYFDTLAEWLASGPWTARQAVLAHLGWIKRYADVYGTASPRRMYERNLR